MPRPAGRAIGLFDRAAVVLPIAALLMVWHPWAAAPTPQSSPIVPPGISATMTPTAGPSPTPEIAQTPPPTPAASASPTPTAAPTPTPTPALKVLLRRTQVPSRTARPAVSSPVLIGAGNVCATSTMANAAATAALIKARPRDLVFTLGDNSYESGTAAQYAGCYARTWGAFLSRTRPVAGNHDYMTAGGRPYYAYFGSRAGAAGKGYYSYNLANNWHVIVLNSMCSWVGGCGVGSRQETWLKADLTANRGKHIVAMWHTPAFSSGSHGNSYSYGAFWTDLYAAHADLILNAHDHDYERFALQSPGGRADSNGIREFVVGTGGACLRSMGKTRANSQVRISGVYGVLELTLGAHSYSWRFIPVAGKTATDSGTQATHS